jgi:hypothetical protein
VITLTRSELIDEIAEAMSDACDMDVSWPGYAEAVLKRLEKNGLVPGPEPDAPCSHCGKPWNFSGPCGWGGCPLGADL